MYIYHAEGFIRVFWVWEDNLEACARGGSGGPPRNIVYFSSLRLILMQYMIHVHDTYIDV